MAVDPNEITGFVLGCVNEGWLGCLEKLCRERIEALAAMRAKGLAGTRGAPSGAVPPKMKPPPSGV